MRTQRQLSSLMLVALQFGLLFLLTALAARPVLAWTIPAAAWLAAALSLAVGVWALSANRLGNFNIRPAPKQGGKLVTSGPYRWIRHPMYTSLLLGAWALVRTAGNDEAWLAWYVLTLVLWIKSRFEERWMLEQHADYAAYRAKTRRFIPWLY